MEAKNVNSGRAKRRPPSPPSPRVVVCAPGCVRARVATGEEEGLALRRPTVGSPAGKDGEGGYGKESGGGGGGGPDD